MTSFGSDGFNPSVVRNTQAPLNPSWQTTQPTNSFNGAVPSQYGSVHSQPVTPYSNPFPQANTQLYASQPGLTNAFQTPASTIPTNTIPTNLFQPPQPLVPTNSFNSFATPGFSTTPPPAPTTYQSNTFNPSPAQYASVPGYNTVQPQSSGFQTKPFQSTTPSFDTTFGTTVIPPQPVASQVTPPPAFDAAFPSSADDFFSFNASEPQPG